MDKELFDINEVCKMLGTTSRTLRFYESKGMVSSTLVPFKNRRQYSREQIDHIKKIIVLRTLGIPVAKIQELQRGRADLTMVIAEHKADLTAFLASKSKELRLLDEALFTIEKGGDIFSAKEELYDHEGYMLKIAEEFVDAFVSSDYERSYEFFSHILKSYMPFTAFKQALHNTLVHIGDCVGKDRVEFDIEYKNIVYAYIRYTKLGLRIKLVYYNDMIHGIWLDYYEL